MCSTNQVVNGFTWMLVLEVFSCLCVAALGGIFEAPWLAYFWYAALVGMACLILLSLLLGLGGLLRGLISYARQLPHRPTPASHDIEHGNRGATPSHV